MIRTRWVTAALAVAVLAVLAVVVGLVRTWDLGLSVTGPGPDGSRPALTHPSPTTRPGLTRAAVAPGHATPPAHPAPARPRPVAGRFEVTATGSASGSLRLRRVIHPDMSHVTFDRSGSYAGVWVLDARGTVVASALLLAGPGHRPYTSSPDALPAGTYTVYVVGKGRVAARIPLRPGEAGLAMRATRPTTASYAESVHTMHPLDSAYTLRLHVPTAPAFGYTGGFINTPARAASTVDVCLTQRGAACRHQVDPEYSQSSELNGRGGYYGQSFALPPYAVAEGRDVLVDVHARSTGSTDVTAWTFTVRLT